MVGEELWDSGRRLGQGGAVLTGDEGSPSRRPGLANSGWRERPFQFFLPQVPALASFQ